jgi:hypothetical protein
MATTCCGDDKKPLLAAAAGSTTTTSGSGGCCASSSYGSTTTTTTTTTCSNKKKLSPKRAQREKDNSNNKRGGGLFGFLSMFTDTDNARTNVRECCSTGTCSECIKEQQRLLSPKLKPSGDSTNSFNSHDSHGSKAGGDHNIHGGSCGNPLSLPCKKKDRDLCPSLPTLGFNAILRCVGHKSRSFFLHGNDNGLPQLPP